MTYSFKTTALLILILMVLSSCQNESNPKQEQINAINITEKKLFETQHGVIDKKEAANIIHQYVKYVDQHPKDSISPYYLFKAADVSINTFHSYSSIELFNRLLSEYPDFEKAPQALFLKAFTFENYLLQLDSAKSEYELFLSKYPNHAFANDAQMSLDNLGKSPEEIVKGFQQ